MNVHLASALCATLLTGFASAQSVEKDRTQTIDTTLEQIRATPEAFKTVRVRFDIQFDSLGRISNPFFTRFISSEYTNFYAWGGNQPIWRLKSYKDVFGMLFISKSSPTLEQIHRLDIYDRVRCEAIVRNTFQGAPWIEVVDVKRIAGSVDTPTLAHLYRGETFMQRRDWKKAISEFSRASGGSQPSFVQSAIQRNIGLCHLRMGEAEEGRACLQRALRLSERKDRELVALERRARQQPGAELDMEIDDAQVPDSQRPMWEAFNEGSTAQTSKPAAPAR